MLHQIGNGALGPVFRAYDSERDRLVAIKVFRLDLPPERVHQLVAELEQLIAAELQHPVIAAPRAAGIDAANNAFLAQDFAAADSLDIVLRENGPAQFDKALRVAGQLADALDYAAERHVLHGGLHPRDILLSEDDIRIIGVGVSRALERVGIASPVRRPYSAPERINEEGWDQRADVFSLAAMVYEMLCGRRVTGTGSEAADGLNDVVGCDVAALQRVFALALAADPTYRFPTAAAFTDALKEAAGTDVFMDAKSADVGVTRTKSRRPRSKLRVVPTSDPSLVDVGAPDALETDIPLPLITFSEEREQRLAGEPPAARLPVQRGAAPTPVAIETALSSTPDPPAHDEPSAPLIVTPPSLEPPDIVMTSSDVPLLESGVEETEPALNLQPTNESVVFDEVPEFEQPSRLPAFLESPAPPVTPVSTSHWPVWPIGVAAVIGMAIGFAVGYTVAIRDRAVSAPSAVATPAAAQPLAPVPVSANDRPSAASTSGGDVPLPRPIEPAREITAPAPTAPVAPLATGRVVVRSNPSGARVVVDGKDRGPTPLTIRDLSEGEHRIRVVRDGYTAAERRVLLTRSRPAQSVSVSLGREPRPRESAAVSKPEVRPGTDTGTLVVQSRPQGATVVVDGRAVGTTPIDLGDIRAGNHSVQLERDGYRTWAASITVTGGEHNRVTASLEK